MRATGRALMRLAALGAAAALLAAAACGEPFPPETLVERLRILGVRAEPPALGPADTAALDALVVDPEGGGRTLRYTWAVCLVEIEDTASDIPCPGPDAYPLPAGPQSELSMPALLAWLAEQDLPFDPEQWQELPAEQLEDIPLLVGLRVDAGEESVRAIKRIHLRFDDDMPQHSNPRLTGLLRDGQPLADPPRPLRLGDRIELRPQIDPDSLDTVAATEDEPAHREDALFSWFSSSGEFDDQRTIWDESQSGTRLEINRWKLPEEETELGPQRLWLVVRDGRYGIDWAEYQFELTAP